MFAHYNLQSFQSETAWLRKAGLIESVGIVDFFTLLSQSWQSLAFIRLLRKGDQLEHFNSIVSKYDTPQQDSARIVEVRLLRKQVKVHQSKRHQKLDIEPSLLPRVRTI